MRDVFVDRTVFGFTHDGGHLLQVDGVVVALNDDVGLAVVFKHEVQVFADAFAAHLVWRQAFAFEVVLQFVARVWLSFNARGVATGASTCGHGDEHVFRALAFIDQNFVLFEHGVLSIS
ncbi:hypothetical protein C5F52_08445 [Limnohabitans sp. TS-CS-82]|nr:hypothetical protein C5F52_08445 [Limnohabitans sp. TS-CS-82]